MRVHLGVICPWRPGRSAHVPSPGLYSPRPIVIYLVLPGLAQTTSPGPIATVPSLRCSVLCRNYAGIQMIHRNLWKQLFPDQAHGDSAETILPATKAKVAEHLEKFGLWDR